MLLSIFDQLAKTASHGAASNLAEVSTRPPSLQSHDQWDRTRSRHGLVKSKI
jgi:hypothetical protein